jgi:hypothetical protein
MAGAAPSKVQVTGPSKATNDNSGISQYMYSPGSHEHSNKPLAIIKSWVFLV